MLLGYIMCSSHAWFKRGQLIPYLARAELLPHIEFSDNVEAVLDQP